MTRLERLRRRASFLALNKTPIYWATPAFVIQVRPWSDAEKAAAPADLLRIGFTATKKLGTAVVRNRARRRLRELTRRFLPAHALPQRDMAFIARAAVLTRPFDLLQKDLLTALTRTGASR